jgi:bifunctional ADP-heptose synthase (sugar kinase/adenylyltransferase)
LEPHRSKIIPFDSAPAAFARLRKKGVKIVQSHGVFELLHPGFIAHLEEARALGDVLTVTVTADKFVRKGPGRPFFKDTLRARTLAALSCVDYVVIAPFPGAEEAINAVRPHFFCRGKDDEERRLIDASVQQALDAAEKVGAQVRYVGTVAYSSTRLLNNHFDHLPAGVKEFCANLAGGCTGQDLQEAVESFSGLKTLVIGDTIFDRYSYVKVQGLTSKNRIISGRFLREETQCGGALAVFRHVKQFTANARFLSLVGTEPWVDPLLREHVAPREDKTIRASDFTTVIKQRFVEPLAEGKELSKLFSVNYIDAEPPRKDAQKRLAETIRREIAWADVVLLLDFGHGMMQPQIRDLVQERAPLLALNCQTNSNNHGFNIISRQYRRADAFSLDEQELLLSVGHRHLNHQAELRNLQQSLKSRYAWLTRGSVQTIGLLDDDTALCPPLETEVIDTIGAGDAFFSVAALSVARKLPVSLATFLGQLAGAQAVRIVGNQHPISKATLLKSGTSLLNF